jgi:hypothetical protein
MRIATGEIDETASEHATARVARRALRRAEYMRWLYTRTPRLLPDFF